MILLNYLIYMGNCKCSLAHPLNTQCLTCNFHSCVSYSRTVCNAQGEACQYSHNNALEPCKQLVLHGICRFGPKCHFSHDSLPEYAVVPLKEWFKEQDQLKVDRAAMHTEEQQPMVTDHMKQQHCEAAAFVEDVLESGIAEQMNSGQQGSAEVQGASPATVGSLQLTPQQHQYQAGSRLAAAAAASCIRYQSWTDGWKRVYHNRLQHMKKIPKMQQDSQDPSTFKPLEAPYSTWQDGWNRLFMDHQKQKT